MKSSSHWLAFGLVALVGCAQGGGGAHPTVGPEGGTVTGPESAKITVPKGAVSTETMLMVEKDAAGAPSVPSGATAEGAIWAFTPHGQTFSTPVTISVPFSGTFSAAMKLMTAQPGGTWTEVPGARQSGGAVEAEVSHFSFFAIVKSSTTDGGALDAGAAPGALNGTWLLQTITCDGGAYPMTNIPATTFTFDGGGGKVSNVYCDIDISVRYPAEGQVEWTIAGGVCPTADGGVGPVSCLGTKHPSAYAVSGTTLTMTESPAPACEYICGEQHKVSTLVKQ